jgi:hypothetical protein
MSAPVGQAQHRWNQASGNGAEPRSVDEPIRLRIGDDPI